MKKNWIPFVLISFTIGCNSSVKVCHPEILRDFVENGSKSILPDFSYAGYAYGEKVIPNVDAKVFNVQDYGATPNDQIDDTRAIQAAVDAAGEAGGGIVFFPPGTFDVNMDTTKTAIVKINYSNIVMRGSGSGPDGTIIHSGCSTEQAEDNSPWLSPFVFHAGLNLQSTDNFFHIDALPVYSELTNDALKGESVLKLERTDSLKSGDILAVAMRNTMDSGDLMEDLMAPFQYDSFMTSYLDAGKQRATSFQYFMEVDQVLSPTEIKMKQPMRRDVLTRFKAFVSKVPMLKEVGIENFRFECDYKGGYVHHLTREHDYGWGAICLQRVSHGWIRNILINNYVQNTHLINSRNVTITNVVCSGFDGHYGPKMYHSSDNLVCNIDVEAKYTHGPGLEGCSFGNVYKDIRLEHPSPIDLHGIADAGFCPPMYNLYENITNLTQMGGGGNQTNLPHAGEYNTFWGLEMTGFDDDGYNELFFSWVWRDAVRFKNEFHIDCHKQYLRSIVVGVHSPKKKISIEHQTNDRFDDWIYVEGLNKDMGLSSLYEYQLGLRLKKQ